MKGPPRGLLAALGLGSAAAFIAGLVLEAEGLRVAVKAVPALALAAWVFLDAAGRAAQITVGGLLLCALGDLLLELGHFVPGLGAFLLGHLCFIGAFVSLSRELTPARALPCYAFGAVMLALVWGGLGPMRAPVIAYTLTICTMLYRAAALVGPARPLAAAPLLPAVAFAVSDALIAVNKFDHPIAGARYAIIALYWAGLFGIARSLVKMTPSRAS